MHCAIHYQVSSGYFPIMLGSKQRSKQHLHKFVASLERLGCLEIGFHLQAWSPLGSEEKWTCPVFCFPWHLNGAHTHTHTPTIPEVHDNTRSQTVLITDECYSRVDQWKDFQDIILIRGEMHMQREIHWIFRSWRCKREYFFFIKRL